MTTEVSLFKGGIPTYLKNQPLNDITKSFLAGGGGGKRISIRGGVFRLVVDGQEIATSEERSMKMVIVNAAPKVSRTYYAGKYDPNAKATAPSCWSADGERPDKSLTEPQGVACATCPQNVKGSGSNGSRACSFSRRLAVVLENDLEGDVFQLSLPSQSIFGKGENGKLPLNAYGQFLAGFNVNITDIVTEMRFDTDSATPKLTFKAARPLTEDEHTLCVDRGASDDAADAVKMSYSTTASVAEPTSMKALVKPTKPAKAVVVEPNEDADEEAREAEPAKRETEPKKRESKKDDPAPKKNLKDVLNAWDDEE